MQQELILKQSMTKTIASKLTFNNPELDGLFPGFKAGDFAVVYGSQLVTSTIAQLCVRAQSSTQLDSKVVYIDAANSSSLSNLLQAAEHQKMSTKTVLENIINLRAYTAYRLTSLITDKLEEIIVASEVKLVVISDIVGPFLNDNVDDQEAKAVYSQIMNYLASLARKHKVIIIATYLSHEDNRRNSTLQEITTRKAGTVLRFTKTLYTSEVELEKHPSYILGVADFTPQVKMLNSFCDSSNVNTVLTLNSIKI